MAGFFWSAWVDNVCAVDSQVARWARRDAVQVLGTGLCILWNIFLCRSWFILAALILFVRPAFPEALQPSNICVQN